MNAKEARFWLNTIVLLSVSAVLAWGATDGMGDRPASDPQPYGDAAIIDAMGCWTDVAPVGVEPTKVLLHEPNPDESGVLGIIRGQRWTNMAIEQEVFGIDHGLNVVAFCP